MPVAYASRTARSRRALATTDTELKLIKELGILSSPTVELEHPRRFIFEIMPGSAVSDELVPMTRSNSSLI